MDGGERKRVFLGMPGYGELVAAAGRSFYMATTQRFQVRREYQQGSLLAANCNKLWCSALNDAKGPGLDYFAMQHADVMAEDRWLDTLIDELEARELDVLGAVVPIKDSLGLTSTAIARLDGDNWRPHARLTMTEVYRLPETFTSADVGAPLLINTGLWVCKFKLDWARHVFFTVNDRIMLNPKGDYCHQVEPEDWFISRLFHEFKLKVGVTRKIAVGHYGPSIFSNLRPWGEWSHDEHAVSESPIAKLDWFPHDVVGWLTKPEGIELAEAAAGKTVLEMGSYCGKSTICLAQNAKAVYAVDTFDGRGTATPGETKRIFDDNIKRAGFGKTVHAWRGLTSDVVPRLPAVFDFVFIDGAHDLESVRADYALAMRVLRPGGLVAFHDYKSGRDPGVDQAVEEVLARGGDLLRHVDSLAVIRPVAAEIVSTV